MTEEEKAKRLEELRADIDRYAKESESYSSPSWMWDATKASAKDFTKMTARGAIGTARGLYTLGKLGFAYGYPVSALFNFVTAGGAGDFVSDVANYGFKKAAVNAAKAFGRGAVAYTSKALAGDDAIARALDSMTNSDLLRYGKTASGENIIDTMRPFFGLKTSSVGEFALPTLLSMGTASAAGAVAGSSRLAAAAAGTGVSAATANATIKTAGAISKAVSFSPSKEFVHGAKNIAVKSYTGAAKSVSGQTGWLGRHYVPMRKDIVPKATEKTRAVFTSTASRIRDNAQKALDKAVAEGADPATVSKLTNTRNAANKMFVETVSRNRHSARLLYRPEDVLRHTLEKKFTKDAAKSTASVISRGTSHSIVYGSGEPPTDPTVVEQKKLQDEKSIYDTSLKTLKGKLEVGDNLPAENFGSVYVSAKEAVKAFRESKDPDPFGTRAKDADAAEKEFLRRIVDHPQFATAVSNQLQRVMIPNKFGFLPDVKEYTPGMTITRAKDGSKLSEKESEVATRNALDIYNGRIKFSKKLVDQIFMEER